jgi:serine protease
MSSTRHLVIVVSSLVLIACGGGQGEIAPAASVPVNSQRLNGPDADRVTELIVKFAPTDPRAALTELNQEAVNFLSQRAGLALTTERSGALGAHVLSFPKVLNSEEARAIASQLAATKGVAYAEPNLRMKASVVPNDPSFSKQWTLVEPEKAFQGARIAGAVNAVAAWDITQGANNVVVAVVDTGILNHSELSGRLLPGYDFVSNVRQANDGTARDANATDPGDWIAATELAAFNEVAPSVSSFHGTHVAGIIAARGNNAIGMAGVSWDTRILPVRVLGKGGGTSSDIADGIVWAAGGIVPGAPINANPAKIINLSLGGNGSCLATTQSAINYARSQGATIIVAAGNENEPSSGKQPANCLGVITVGAVGWTGAKASYSNYGAPITIAAPGGDSDGAILSLGDQGRQSPLGDNTFVYQAGTSMATPVVTGVVALMLSVNPNLTPDEIKSILTYTANAFPTVAGKVSCTLQLCGAGIVNALAAVRAASSGSVGTALPAPQSGWWYQGEAEGGRGYAIEIHNNSLFMAGFTYQIDGRPTWFVSTGSMTDISHFTGTMLAYSGGQTLGGTFKPAAQTGNLGAIQLAFTSATQGLITWPNGSKTNIVRYNIPGATAGASTKQNAFTPEAGWWWNPTEGGRGFAIEVQGDRLFIAGFMYDAQGLPTWYVSWGKMTNGTTYNGMWSAFANGQAIGQAFKPPVVANDKVGGISLVFSDGRNAVLTLPTGATVALGRFLDYGIQTPVTSDPPSLMRANKLLGQWRFAYTIITTWIDNFLFKTIFPSDSMAGRYVAVGYNQNDRLTVAFFYEASNQYAMLTAYPAAEGFTFDDFYVFDLNSDASGASGCYYLSYHNGNISRCYQLEAVKTGGSGFSVPDITQGKHDASLEPFRREEIAKQALDVTGVSPSIKRQAIGHLTDVTNVQAIKELRALAQTAGR